MFALGGAGHLQRPLHVGEARGQRRGEALGGGRRQHVVAGPLEKRDAEVAFEPPQLVADRAMGEVQLARRLAIALVADGRLHRSQGRNRGQPSHGGLLVRFTTWGKNYRSLRGRKRGHMKR